MLGKETKTLILTPGCIWLTDLLHPDSAEDQDLRGRHPVHQAAGDCGQGVSEAHRAGLPRHHGEGDHHEARTVRHAW